MARSPLHILTITVLVLAVAAAYMLMGATAAGASPGLTVGIAGNQFIDSHEAANAASEGIGLGGVRVFLAWHGERNVTEADRWRLAQLAGRRSLISIYGEAADAPLTPAARGAFAAYTAQVVGLFHPWAVSVWNEPNLDHFWYQNGRAAEDYERLLARTYDAVKGVDRRVLVLGGETVRTNGVERWIKRVGRRYRDSGRSSRKPLMDGWAHHPYPQAGDHEASDATGRGTPLWLVQGDARRMRAALAVGFRGTKQKRWTPIYWTETGWTTGSPSQWVALASAELQGVRMADAVELAYCQKRVRAIFFFQLWDDRPTAELGLPVDSPLVAWQTGILNADLTRKPSFGALAAAIANVNAGNVDCSRFPAASL